MGVGILWQQGYFRQVLDAVGRQTELYPSNEPASLPVQPVLSKGGEHLRVTLAFPATVPVTEAPGAECHTVRDGKITHIRIIFDRLPFTEARQAAAQREAARDQRGDV